MKLIDYFAGWIEQDKGFTENRDSSGMQLQDIISFNFWNCKNGTACITSGHFEYAA